LNICSSTQWFIIAFNSFFSTVLDDASTSRGLCPPQIPDIGDYFDVHVTMAANPGNFTVIVHLFIYFFSIVKVQDEHKWCEQFQIFIWQKLNSIQKWNLQHWKENFKKIL
jgi:hypothetical protein